MTYTVIATHNFKRRARQVRRGNPQLAKRIDRTLRDLATDPFQPHLRLHPLHGTQRNLHAMRIDYDNRIMLTVQVSVREITLLDIGSHDEVCR